jgi:hypothetical protein
MRDEDAHVTDAADELFDVEPRRFVERRDEVVRALRADDRADEAAAVRKLRRPTVAVWALNQIARHDVNAVDALLRAGTELAAAQRRGDGAALRRAAEEINGAVGDLVAAAARRIGEHDVGAVPEAEIETALRSLARGGESAAVFRAGRLQQLPEATTGTEMWEAGAARATRGAPGTAEPTADRSRKRGHAAHLSEARAAARDAERDRARAEKEQEGARARVESLRAELAHEEQALREAEARLGDAARASDAAARSLAELEE